MTGANIVIKGFEYGFGARILERAFDGIPIGRCISILNKREEMPHLRAEQQEWLSAGALRAARYDVDWNTIAPLDEEIVESMRDCEATVIEMLTRFEGRRTFGYEERRRMYLAHLRYWNHVLAKQEISLFLLSHVPHQCYDNVLYALCKKRGIPVLFLHPGPMPDQLFLERDIEDPLPGLRGRWEAVHREHPDGRVPLSPEAERYYERQTNRGEDPNPWYVGSAGRYATLGGRLRTLSAEAVKLAFRKPAAFLRSLGSPDVWGRNVRKQQIIRFFERHAESPDLSRKFIYVPLHLQPECSTCPMGGVYSDQLLMVQLLAASVPPGVLLYIKEHPFQDERCRSVAFYRSLLAIPQVRFVPKTLSTFRLTEACIAIATVTGTAAFEGIFRGKPAFLFGHAFHQEAPGVFPVRTAEDCQNAMRAIVGGAGPELPQVRCFLKALDELTIRGYVGKGYDTASTLSREENIENVGNALSVELRTILA